MNVFWNLPNAGVANSNTTGNMDTRSRISVLCRSDYVEKSQCHDQTFKHSKNVHILHRTAVNTTVKRKFY
jgi:hypothetical protein